MNEQSDADEENTYPDTYEEDTNTDNENIDDDNEYTWIGCFFPCGLEVGAK